MSENSKIEWTDHTFNPWEGCQKVGPGCDHCYAEARNARFGGGIAPNWGPGAPRRRMSKANWRKPIAWNAAQAEFFAANGRRQRVFCASLADVFDNEVDQAWRDDLWQLIHATPDLDWLLLTKRIGNAIHMLPGDPDIYPNVWLGATIVNQAEADRDIPKLLDVPAAVRFLSMEPLLGAVDLTRVAWMQTPTNSPLATRTRIDALKGIEIYDGGTWAQDCAAIDWVIVGGESGTGARPMHPDWARSLRDQCAAAGVPFLFKQWGEHVVLADGAEACRVCGCTWNNACSGGCYWAEPGLCSSCVNCEPASGDRAVKFARVGKRTAGRELDGVTHDGFPGECHV